MNKRKIFNRISPHQLNNMKMNTKIRLKQFMTRNKIIIWDKIIINILLAHKRHMICIVIINKRYKCPHR